MTNSKAGGTGMFGEMTEFFNTVLVAFWVEYTVLRLCEDRWD
jgi:hypothetical protein